MHEGKLVFAQPMDHLPMDHLPMHTFRRTVARFVKKRPQLKASLYTILQSLSVTPVRENASRSTA